ncbi:tRNA (adenine(22)-N(1))-methyltransferase [Numidum massiliense]|uniref:tRNA (adenine(22)-N(1))-methyltransferase n=1 Tax=Numidum massiliense TaxID=1522315 RepID=UPI0009EC0FC8|nr:class I SAM-dependent methyltransferase [Numidum massiliense]
MNREANEEVGYELARKKEVETLTLLKSERLMQIAEFVLRGEAVADIGTDHALLPRHLLASGYVPRAVAVEVSRGPYDVARERVAASGLSAKIELRLGDGLTALVPGEVATVVIAGMGGPLICDILQNGQAVLSRTKRLVLQPNVAVKAVRKWLLAHRWQLICEALVYENGHYYDILVAEHGDARQPYREAFTKLQIASSGGMQRENGNCSERLRCFGEAHVEELLTEIGPLLWSERHPLLRPKLEVDMAKFKRILQQLAGTAHGEARRKQVQIKAQMTDWEEMMTCLPKEKTLYVSSIHTSHRT